MNKIIPTLCIFHANCNDGFASALAVWMKYPNIEFAGVIYGAEPPDCKYHDVIMVDFSYKHDTMKKIIKKAKSVTVLDHHKTAEKEIASLLESGDVQGIFDMNHSGAVLTWNYFHPSQPIPEFFLHIEDRDLWKFDIHGTKEIHAALGCYPFDFNIWQSLLYKVPEHKDIGLHVLAKEKKEISQAVKSTLHKKQLGGYEVYIANLPGIWASDGCHIMCEMENFSNKFAASYYDKENVRCYSLRSISDFDVSKIAEKYGGGGHKNAAGFEIPHHFTFEKYAEHIADIKEYEKGKCLSRSLEYLEVIMEECEINLDIINLVRYFLNKLPKDKIFPDYIEPCVGGLILKWKDKDEKVILTFDKKYLYMSYEEENNTKPFFIDNVSFKINDEIPNIILKFIPKTK